METESTPEMITIGLSIENTYERYPAVTTYAPDVVLPAPPPQGTDAYTDWADQHILPLTGVGHTDGDSWYDVTVIACSDPSMVGRTFDWGY